MRRVDLAHTRQHVDVVGSAGCQIGQHHRHRSARRDDLVETGDGVRAARRDLDPLVPPVPIEFLRQLRADRRIRRADQSERFHAVRDGTVRKFHASVSQPGTKSESAVSRAPPAWPSTTHHEAIASVPLGESSRGGSM